MCTRSRCTHKLYIDVLLSQHEVIQFRGRNVNIVKNGRNRFLHSSLLKIWDFFHSCEKFYVFSLVLLHSWKKSQIFNRDSCKNLLIVKRKQTTEQTMINKTQHRKLKIEQHEPHPKTGVDSEVLFIRHQFSNMSVMCHAILSILLYSISYFATCFVVEICQYTFNVETIANHLKCSVLQKPFHIQAFLQHYVCSNEIAKQLLKMTMITIRSFSHF